MKVMVIIGLVCGLLAGAGGVLFLQHESAAARNPDDILFPEKNFFDNGSWVAVSGTLTGPGMAYPNNTYALSCLQDKRECIVSYIEQIGPNQIGRMENPWIIPITKWDRLEIVAEDEGYMFACYRTVVTISRSTKAAAWVEMPINQTKPECVKASSTPRKFSIEDSAGWKTLRSH